MIKQLEFLEYLPGYNIKRLKETEKEEVTCSIWGGSGKIILDLYTGSRSRILPPKGIFLPLHPPQPPPPLPRAL